MKMKLAAAAILTLLSASTAFATAAAHHPYPSHPKLPKPAAVQKAIAKVSVIDGAISNLIAIADGEGGESGQGRGPHLENDVLARNVLLIMSRKTERVLDKLDELDGHLASGDIIEALLAQTEACEGLDGISKDNIGARAAADLIHVGSLTSDLEDFALIDETVSDTKSTVRCP